MRVILPVLIILLACQPARALTFFSLGAADVDGTYYRLAQAVCEIVNRQGDPEMRCSPESTPGSIYNLQALRDGQLDLAIVQSDWQRHALEGTSVFAGSGPMTGLRSVMALYEESFTVLARRGAGIASFSDLRGKRVDIGHPSSGRQATMRVVMDRFGMATTDFAATYELQTGPALAELCAGTLDATVLITGHPSANVARALGECDVALVPVTGPQLRALTGERPEYRPSAIALADYGLPGGEVPTLAVMATLVAWEGTDPEVVGAVAGLMLKNLPSLRGTLPVLGRMEPVAMRDLGLSAPMHPAAAAAFDGLAQ